LITDPEFWSPPVTGTRSNGMSCEISDASTSVGSDDSPRSCESDPPSPCTANPFCLACPTILHCPVQLSCAGCIIDPMDVPPTNYGHPIGRNSKFVFGGQEAYTFEVCPESELWRMEPAKRQWTHWSHDPDFRRQDRLKEATAHSRALELYAQVVNATAAEFKRIALWNSDEVWEVSTRKAPDGRRDLPAKRHCRHTTKPHEEMNFDEFIHLGEDIPSDVKWSISTSAELNCGSSPPDISVGALMVDAAL